MTAKEKNGDSTSDDLADDIVGITSYSYGTRPEKSFKPWHRPRKQYVRSEQWSYYISELVEAQRPPDEALSYFGLPGVDLLDIRHFGSTVCDSKNIKLRFLGFDKDAAPEGDQQSEFNISYDEVSKTSFFHPQSEIIAYDLRELVNEDSIAWQKTLEFGPFDVVNLDLCDGVAKEPSGDEVETYYNAISKLLSVQARRKSPWLLFLTTRVGQKHVHEDAVNGFTKLYQDNLTNCREFAQISREKLAIADEAALQAAKAENLGFQRVNLIGLCKWLLGFALGQQPPASMEVKNLLGYRVKKDAEVEDMVSIAIRFDPTHAALPDASKLASIKDTRPDECALATLAAKRVAAMLDVDDYLSSQGDIHKEMIESMCGLLESARYDVDQYRRWIGI